MLCCNGLNYKDLCRNTTDLYKMVEINIVLSMTSIYPVDYSILGFHVTSPNSRIQNWEAYKIFTFIQGKIT